MAVHACVFHTVYPIKKKTKQMSLVTVVMKDAGSWLFTLLR